jgi:chemotaxis protein MotB
MTRQPRPVPNPHAVRASGDRWLFGYADIVTLLFACFASLYAASLTPATSTVEAEEKRPPLLAPVPPVPVAAELEQVIGDALSLPGVEMTTSLRGLVISLPEAGSFPAGRAELSEEARSVMLDLADRLRTLPNMIRVEGHTDDVPIATSQFASNWELSTARATRVVQFLIEECELDPARLAAAGYAEYRPRLPNTTTESRARNRRVDIVVLDPATARREEPGENGR